MLRRVGIYVNSMVPSFSMSERTRKNYPEGETEELCSSITPKLQRII